jgi:pilus assembly protein Flp/PilA
MHYTQSQTGTPTQEMENLEMNNKLMKLYLVAKSLIEREEGQDLVEYALVVALIAFGAITGMGYLSTGLNHAFSGISSTLTSNV